MDPFKDFLVKNHPEAPEASPYLMARIWNAMQSQKNSRKRFYLGFSTAFATLALVIGLSFNNQNKLIQEQVQASFDEETFILESMSDFEDVFEAASQENGEEYAFGF